MQYSNRNRASNSRSSNGNSARASVFCVVPRYTRYIMSRRVVLCYALMSTFALCHSRSPPHCYAMLCTVMVCSAVLSDRCIVLRHDALPYRCLWGSKILLRRRHMGKLVSKKLNRAPESSFCCWLAVRRLAHKECFFTETGIPIPTLNVHWIC